MKASLFGKLVWDLGNVQIVNFLGGIFSHEIMGSKPIIVAPNLVNVILKDRHIVVNEKANLCIEENEGFVLVKPFNIADPAIKEAITKDPDIIKRALSLYEGVEQFFEHLSHDGEIAKIFEFIFEKVKWEQVLVEMMTMSKEAYPDFYQQYIKKLSPADLEVLQSLIGKDKI